MADLNLPGWNAISLLPVARLVGVGEVALAVAAGWVGGRLFAGLVGLAYLVFALVVFRLLKTSAGADCGCFGAARSPLTYPHLVVNLIFAATAGLGVWWPPTGLRDGSVTGVGEVLLVSAFALVLAAMGYLLFTAFPALLRDRAVIEAAS